MSILDRIAGHGHLDEGALARVWSEAQARGAARPEDTHLATCAQCQARYASFSEWLSGIRDEGVAEADDAFPAERLAVQQAQIMRRLEALERPARVLAFPRLRRPATVSRGGPQRWIAAAAAAGLIVGLAAGQLLDLGHTLNRSRAMRPTPAATQLAKSGARGAVQPVRALVSDESLLYDTAPAPSIPELQPLDTLTPRIRDMDQQSR